MEDPDYEQLWHAERDRYYQERARHQDAELASLKELMASEMHARDEALRLKSESDSVHFLALNNEAERVAAAADKSVSRDVYDANREADRQAIGVALDAVKEQRATRRASREGVESLRVWMIFAASVLFGVIGAVLGVISKG